MELSTHRSFKATSRKHVKVTIQVNHVCISRLSCHSFSWQDVPLSLYYITEAMSVLSVSGIDWEIRTIEQWLLYCIWDGFFIPSVEDADTTWPVRANF